MGGNPPPGKTPPPIDKACAQIGGWYWNAGVSMHPGSAQYEMDVTGKDDVRWEFRLNKDAPGGPKSTQGYDGCKDGELIEAKSGCDLWDSENHDRIRQQALRQLLAVRANNGSGLIWYYAAPNIPSDLRKWLEDRGVTLVFHARTPPC